MIVRDVTDEQEMLILALVENVDRSEMPQVEEGDGYLTLGAQGLSNAEIARKVGVTDARGAICIFCAELPQKTRELMNNDQLFISNQTEPFLMSRTRALSDAPRPMSLLTSLSFSPK